MKKRILTAIAGIVLCAAAFTGYKVYENQTAPEQSDLLTKNLEALTQGENGWYVCSGSPMVLICVGSQDYIIDTGYRIYL